MGSLRIDAAAAEILMLGSPGTLPLGAARHDPARGRARIELELLPLPRAADGVAVPLDGVAPTIAAVRNRSYFLGVDLRILHRFDADAAVQRTVDRLLGADAAVRLATLWPGVISASAAAAARGHRRAARQALARFAHVLVVLRQRTLDHRHGRPQQGLSFGGAVEVEQTRGQRAHGLVRAPVGRHGRALNGQTTAQQRLGGLRRPALEQPQFAERVQRVRPYCHGSA